MTTTQQEDFLFYIETLKNLQPVEGRTTGVIVVQNEEEKVEVKKISQNAGYTVGESEKDTLAEANVLFDGKTDLITRILEDMGKSNETKKGCVVFLCTESEFDALPRQDLLTSVFRVEAL